MKLLKMHWIGISFGILLSLLSAIFFLPSEQYNLFYFVTGIGLTSIVLPFVVGIVLENKREQEMAEMFLEFSRNLAESVVTGTPISKSIINMSRKNYGALSPHVIKLANQISLGIPVNSALQTFARDVDNPVISRAIALISEAERAGGEIDYILDSVAKSISEVEKIKQERQAAISSLVVQGYLIFFIFIGIMMVMEFQIIPLALQAGSLGELSGGGGGADLGAVGGLGGGGGSDVTSQDISSLFLYLLLAQGFFTGIAIGKLAEGSLKAGVKHSFIMTISALLLSTGVRVFFGGA